MEFNFKKLPDDIIWEIKQFIIYKPKNNEELRNTINLYNNDKKSVINYMGIYHYGIHH